MSAQLADDELLIRRTFDAPPELIFSLWAEEEHFRKWMGPEGFDCRQAVLDFRVGGSYRAMIYSEEHGKTGSAASIARSSQTAGWSSPSPGTRGRQRATKRL